MEYSYGKSWWFFTLEGSAVVMDALLIVRYVRVTYVRRKYVVQIVVPGGEEWYSWKIN